MTSAEDIPWSKLVTEKDKARLWSKIRKAGPDECWLWTACCQPDGHGLIKLFGKEGRNFRVHRLVYILIHGDLPTNIVVRHTCDTPACCNPAHLITGTHGDNVADRVARNRSARGVNNGRSKLNWETVADIREQLVRGATPMQLAKAYGVDSKTIRLLRDNVTWRTGEN